MIRFDALSTRLVLGRGCQDGDSDGGYTAGRSDQHKRALCRKRQVMLVEQVTDERSGCGCRDLLRGEPSSRRYVCTENTPGSEIHDQILPDVRHNGTRRRDRLRTDKRRKC